MINIFLDIETIPTQDVNYINNVKQNITAPAQYKKADSIQKWIDENGEKAAQDEIAKTSFNGGLGQVFCIAVSQETGKIERFVVEDLSLSAEKDMLESFNLHIKEVCGQNLPYFIGHYIAEFDLKFIFQRMVVHNIKPSVVIPFNEAAYKDMYFDTMTNWAGWKGKVSLDNLCYYLGIDTPKTELDGSKVWQYVKDGKYTEVADYCCRDVAAVKKVYNRLTFKELINEQESK